MIKFDLPPTPNGTRLAETAFGEFFDEIDANRFGRFAAITLMENGADFETTRAIFDEVFLPQLAERQIHAQAGTFRDAAELAIRRAASEISVGAR